LADEHQTHDPARERAPQAARPTPDTAANESLTLPAAALSLALLGHPAIGGRGNGAVRAAAIQRLQQSYGNRAVQRMFARTSVAVQRVGGFGSSSESESESENESESESESESDKKKLKRKYVSGSASESEEEVGSSESESEFLPDEDGDGPEPPEEYDKEGRKQAYPTSWSTATKNWAEREAKALGLCPLCTKSDLTAKIPIPGKRAQAKRDKQPTKAAAQLIGHRRGYDIDHHSPKWSDRLAAINELVFQGTLVQPSAAILHRVYNSKLRVTCPGCNTSHAHEAKVKNFKIDDYDGTP